MLLAVSLLSLLLLLGAPVLLQSLFQPITALITLVLIGALMGALAVYLLEVLPPHTAINAGVLWAQVGCLLVGLALLSLVPLVGALLNFNQGMLIGILLGVFWRGKRYWR